MKVPSKAGVNIEPLRHGSVRQECDSKQVGWGRRKEADAFHRLLADTIHSIRAKGTEPVEALALDAGKLRQLAEIVQIQMNQYLFQAVVERDETDASNGFALDWMNFPLISSQLDSLVSNFQQGQQKTVGIQSEYDIDDVIDHASSKYGVDPDLARAVIRAESDFDPNCTSPKGAMGLMQLMPETAEELGVKNPYNPVENIMAGTRYLKGLLDRYEGKVALALAAYNWGMGNVERHPDRLPKETQVYIARVNQYYREATS